MQHISITSEIKLDTFVGHIIFFFCKDSYSVFHCDYNCLKRKLRNKKIRKIQMVCYTIKIIGRIRNICRESSDIIEWRENVEYFNS